MPEFTIDQEYLDYLAALKKTAFQGDIKTDYAARLAVATDNSVYQVIPQAVLLPKNTQDVAIVLHLCQQEAFKTVTFAPRGGGTATNGQSLSAGIVIDCSQYMRNIIEINLKEGWVRAQPGVVLDQLNHFLKPHGMYFPPEISPSNRATLGGMINTDACGNGSKVIGRTSDYIASLTCVLSNGRVINTEQMQQNDNLCENIKKLLVPHQKLIQEKFVARPRNLNGYNLLNTVTDTMPNLNYLFSGSEGTLGIITECKLKIKPIPAYSKLVLVKYRNFDEALRSQNLLEKTKPLVVEAIDEKLLELSRQDPIYFHLKDMMDSSIKPGAINLIEFSAETEEMLDHSLQILCDEIDKKHAALGYYIAKNDTETKLLWELRKKSVGLISKGQQATRRPIPFVEDTAVPPERLADYISEFKKLLDKHHLLYGMYGHVDAGCVHVRPALDLKQAEDEALFRELSDAVAALVEKFGGVMWGEHGMGFRCQYAEHFFGEKLYHVVRQIKTLFDPQNRLNPGKIAVPLDADQQLVQLTGPLRAKLDKQIPTSVQSTYDSAMACNGNGACFNYATQDAMCPSFKVTKDRIHSPKGRATVMREWLRLLAKQGVQKTNIISRVVAKFTKQDFSHEVYAAMHGCLSCKACAFQCPLNVDIPETKAKFLEKYHQRYLRPMRDYLSASIEKIAPIQSHFPRLMNGLLQNSISQFVMKYGFKLVGLPRLSDKPIKKTEGIETIYTMTQEQKANTVIILQDAFTSYYEADLVNKVIRFFDSIKINVIMLPFFANGKPLYVKGFLDQFTKVARKNIAYLREIAALGIPMFGIDPSITLTYRDEYQKIIGNEKAGFNIQLLQEWLMERPDILNRIQIKVKDRQYYLLSHCTEKTACVAAEKQWQTIFAVCGIMLTPLAAGCCGMAGVFGHEAEHLQQSNDLFLMDWDRYLTEKPLGSILATGYSCRSQIKRFKDIKVQHPIEILF